MHDDCDCGEGRGVLWPWETDGDDSYPWVERCDDCKRYPDDERAAEALADRMGTTVRYAEHPTLLRQAPYIQEREGGDDHP